MGDRAGRRLYDRKRCPDRLVAAPLFVRNLLALLSGALTLFGVNPFGMEFGFSHGFPVCLHGAALVIVVAASSVLRRRLFGRRQAICSTGILLCRYR